MKFGSRCAHRPILVVHDIVAVLGTLTDGYESTNVVFGS